MSTNSSEGKSAIVSFKDILLVEEAVGGCFGDVFREDVRGGGHVCDGAG